MSLPTPSKYPLQSVALSKQDLDILSFFSTRNIQYIRVQWVDLLNQVRFWVLPLSYFRRLLASERPGVATSKVVLGMLLLQIAPGFSMAGEDIYVFDLSSVRTCHYAPRHAVLFGFFQKRIPIPRPNGPSFDMPFCPRTVLQRLIKYAHQELGIQFLIGFETEFTLLKSTNPIVAVDVHQYSSALAFPSGAIQTQVLDEIADAIQADGIDLQKYHAEAAPGQFEVSTGPMTPLEAADALVHTREIIYNTASKHSLRATFAPRLALDSCGTGAHMHVSVHGQTPGLPEPTSECLTPAESAFLSGLMHHLPSVIAFTLPLASSYARMADGIWSGGTWVSWGIDQREAPVRLTNADSPSSRNFEIRPIDGTSNPYLVVASVLACGVIGIREKLELKVKGIHTSRAAAQMDATEREAFGITKRLPLNLEEARKNLVAAETIKDVLGDELVNKFIVLDQMLEKLHDRGEHETEAQAMQRLVESY